MKIRRKHSRGISALEVVMSAGVLLPLCAGALFLGAKMYQYVFGIISTLVGWPYP